jgi:hypothetical protein
MSFNYQQPQGGQGQGPNFYQQYANSYNQNPNFNDMQHQDVYNHYQQFAQQVPPQQLYQAHQNYYQQMPQPQRQGLMDGILGAFRQHGINPQQAGIQGTEPTPQNLAAANQYAAQNPDILQKVFGPGGALSSPIAKAALAGGLAFAAKNFFEGGGFQR